jgi:hypothetical protein
VRVSFGDGAREPSVPCTPPSCGILLGSPILGNASPSSSDTILLDTVAPVARLGKAAVTVERGDAAVFDAASSTDLSPAATPSGVDFPATTWDFADGTPVARGSRVSHAFGRIGTFVGRLRVRDRAGNVSDVTSFPVTVIPRAGETIDGFGSIAGVRGSAAFALSRISVSARYARSRLSGSILVQGISSRPGTIVATIRTARGTALLSARRDVQAAPFTRGLRLPPTLLPGVYRLDFAGPGGTLASTLTLRPPREGVASSAKVTLRGRPRARFVFAALPIQRLRSKVTVTWAQGRRRLGTVRAGSGPVARAGLPAGATARAGTLTATLRAGTAVVAVASARVR